MSEHLLLILGVLAAAIAATLLAVWFLWLRIPKHEAAAVGYEPIAFAEIEGWLDDDQSAAFLALLRSCNRTKAVREAQPCADALALAAKGAVGRDQARLFFETHYTPYRVLNAVAPGKVTGYYEPEVEGSRVRSDKFSVPVYARPADLDQRMPDELRAQNNDKITATRKTPDGNAPYFTRQEIEQGALKGRGLEILYLADPVELFFMQVQGSGRIRLPDGSRVRLGYAGKNGHPYTSIGKALVALGQGSPKSMSMQGIKDWLHADKERGQRLMWQNKSYVFFTELTGDAGADGPLGAQGVALTPGRSIAVDPAYNALGLPIFVEAAELTKPDGKPFRRLMIAQDVGSAIKGPQRADIFWGSGDQAGAIAGTTLAPATFIVLKPNDAAGS
jgi:membrane-bound lytic murein transglycosylase A